MKLRGISLTIATAFALSACTNENLTTAEKKMPAEIEEPVQAIVPGKAIVLFSDELIEVIEQDLERGEVVTKSSGLNTLTSALNVSAMERVFPYAGEYEEGKLSNFIPFCFVGDKSVEHQFRLRFYKPSEGRYYASKTITIETILDTLFVDYYDVPEDMVVANKEYKHIEDFIVLSIGD